MRVTSNKIINRREEVSYFDDVVVRVQVKVGVIVSISCLFENGDLQGWEGKTDKDKKIIGKMNSTEVNYLEEILGQVEV